MAINNSSGCNNLIHFADTFTHFSVFASCIVCLESVLLIVIVWRTPGLHTNTHMMVASLSVGDLAVGLFYIINGVTSLAEFKNSAREPNALANFVMGSNFGTSFITIIHMAIIAIDRCVNITHPFYYMRTATTTRTLKILFCIWITGLTYTAAPMLAYTHDKYHEKCIQMYPPLEYYCILAVVYFFSSSIVFGCYFKIAAVAFKHKKAAIARRAQLSATGDDMFRNSRLAVMKSVKFFVLTSGLFTLCTLPPIFATGVNYWYAVPQYILIPLTYMCPVHQLLNFPLYLYMNRDFSQAMRTYFTSLRRCCCG